LRGSAFGFAHNTIDRTNHYPDRGDQTVLLVLNFATKSIMMITMFMATVAMRADD
jgi:hypothetical protein